MRDLPWRNTRDPYLIWLSEVILQQTQVSQGLAYYLRFSEKYPTVQHLAQANEEQVLKLWQGLGYYSRARNMHAAAKQIVREHSGVFPDEYESIRNLPGVGDYTAAAIASFAYRQAHAVVDGNVYRVLARVFGISTAIDSTAGKKQFRQLAESVLDRRRPDIHNQAIMEFGALYCRPASPDCENCIFNEKCVAHLKGLVNTLPVKAKKQKVRDRFFNYVVPVDNKGNVAISRREKKDIWQGLYEFRLLETAEPCPQENFVKLPELQSVVGKQYEVLHISKEYRHILSHQNLHTRFYVIRHKNKVHSKDHTIPLNKLTNYAFPRLIEKFLEDCDLKEIL